MSRIFDALLKLIVGIIVICFVALVVYLARQGEIDWASVGFGFLPKLSQWNHPAPDIQQLIAGLPAEWQAFWSDEILVKQRRVMISTTATAVGINMTFLLPYSMIARGWDKPFRGLARFDLISGMGIPFVLVTSSIVMASAYSFHAKADPQFLSDRSDEVQQSKIFSQSLDLLEKRYELQYPSGSPVNAPAPTSAEDSAVGPQQRQALMAQFAASLSYEERILAASLVKPNTGQLAKSLSPLLGDKLANLVFGLGAFAMGLSTIIILMLINGYAVAEIAGRYENRYARIFGALLAAAMGFCWMWIWTGKSQTWLIIVASTFGAILLPIAYLSFFFLMNNRQLLAADKPIGWRMVVWNLLMIVGVAGAVAQAYLATSLEIGKSGTGSFVAGGLATFTILALVGFSARFQRAKVSINPRHQAAD